MKDGRVNDANGRFRNATGQQIGAMVEREWKGEALTQMGDRLRQENRFPEALSMYGEAANVYSDGPSDRPAGALRRLGDMQMEAGQLPAAKSTYEKALEQYRSSFDELGEARILERLGTLASHRE